METIPSVGLEPEHTVSEPATSQILINHILVIISKVITLDFAV